MSKGVRGVSTLVLAAALAIAVLHAEAQAQMGPNPYRPVGGLQAGGGPGLMGEPWARLPDGREWGPRVVWRSMWTGSISRRS